MLATGDRQGGNNEQGGTECLDLGIYLVGLGLVLLLIPNVILPLFGFPTTEEVWIRVVGFTLDDDGALRSQALHPVDNI
jgi:hypothetical protein